MIQKKERRIWSELIFFLICSLISDCLQKEFNYISEHYSTNNDSQVDNRTRLLLNIDNSDKLSLHLFDLVIN